MAERPTLSTFYVVKNEAPTMRRALESVLPVCDQYVIGIDDTSSDGTAEIIDAFVREHPEKEFDVYRFTWENDFSKARNAAIERCTKDWIFQLDGHEYLLHSSVPMLRKYMDDLKDEIWLVSVRMWLEPIWTTGADETAVIPEVWFIQTHLWRNGKGIRYQFASHNQITKETCPIEHRMNTPDIVIVHDRPPENAEARRIQRAEMNTPNFQKDIKADPKSERGLFYLAMSYVDSSVIKDGGEVTYDRKKLKRAARYAEKYLKVWGHAMPEQAFEMASKLGEVCATLEDWDRAEDAFFECIRLQPMRAEGYFHLGMVSVQRMNALTDEYFRDGALIPGKFREEYYTRLYNIYSTAEKWFTNALDVAPPVTSYFLKAPVYEFLPLLKLAELSANIYLFTGQPQYYAKARKAYVELLERLPHNLELQGTLKGLDEKYREIMRRVLPKKDKPAIAIFNSTYQFTDHLAERWRNYGNLVNTWKQAGADGVTWGDVLFSGWCDKNAVALSGLADRPLYVRLCRYEAYTDLPKQVNWRNVKELIVTSETMKRYVTDSFDIACPVRVIYHGVDLDKFPYAERGHGENVAWVAFFHSRKDPMMLAEIVGRSDKHFHLATKVQMTDLWRAFWTEIRRIGATDRVHFHGWQEDMNGWLDKINAHYLLSTSWSESFGYNIAEAMAKGIKPIIRRFEGVDELWPAECIYDDVPGALDQFGDAYRSERYRAWVAERYDADVEARIYQDMFFGGMNADK